MARTLLTRDLEAFLLNADRLSEFLSDSIATMEAGSVSGNLVLHIYEQLHAAVNDATRLRWKNAIVNIARTELNDGTYDFAARAQEFITACQDAASWIETNYPTDPQGWLLHQKFDAGSLSTRGLDTPVTAGLRTVLQAVIDAVP